MKPGEPAAMPEDQAAELAALQAAAGEVPAPGAVVATVDPSAEAADLLKFVVYLAVPFFPRLEPVYTDDVIRRLAGPAGGLMVKYGFTLGGFMDQWKEEVAFLLVAGPLVLPTIQAIRPEEKPVEKTVEGAPVANE